MRVVVIIDDEADIRALLRTILPAEGFEVVGEAATGRDGVELVAQTHPDGVVLDFQMAPETGLDVLPEIKQAWPATRVVLFTAVPHEGLTRRAHELGAAAVIRKGDSLTNLMEALRGEP